MTGGKATDTAGSAGAVAEGVRIARETRAKLTALRARVQANVGQAVLAMMNLPRYRHQTLGDLNHVVIEPLLRDRVAIASLKPNDDPEGEPTAAGMAIWASVSDEVDGKIREQVKAGVFPVRLAAEDWVSGEKLWLLDLIAPNRSLATAVLANFRQIAGDKAVSIHPIVVRSVDREVLEKMRGERPQAQPEQ